MLKFTNIELELITDITNTENVFDYSIYLLSTGDFYTVCSKLLLDFTDKNNYVIHIRTLCLYYQLGCE